jgi:hypothetical protein
MWFFFSFEIFQLGKPTILFKTTTGSHCKGRRTFVSAMMFQSSRTSFVRHLKVPADIPVLCYWRKA